MMAENYLKGETEGADSVANSYDIERVYALNSALANVDEFLESPEFCENNYVRRIVDLLDKESSVRLQKEKIGIDFSSPNVAKPFHVGHLRSTFIGRAIGNLLVSSGSDVVRINYLGDWGTQFGLLAAGCSEFGDDLIERKSLIDDAVSSARGGMADGRGSRLRQFFELYVKANDLAEKDDGFRRKALDYFARLEGGEEESALKFWRDVVEDSVEELHALYSRLNVQFDAWESEKSASAPAKLLMEELESRNLLERNEENVLGMRVAVGPQDHFVPLVKSDGTTLYLTRDVYSALRRFDHLSCKRLLYVTDARQQHHFLHLKAVLAKIGREDVANGVQHVPYGRILNMSSRKGLAVFVDDILDEGMKKAEEVLCKDPNTKTAAGTMERLLLCEQLTLTGVVINDLRKRLSLEYEFDWKQVLETKRDSGVNLQRTFCRLSSICQQQRCASPVDLETFRRSINEPESLQLAAHLSRRLAPALVRSFDGLQLFPLTQHLFRLRKLCSAAVRNLRVADAPTPALRSSRFLLFDVSRKVLGLGLRVLGAKPLAKI